MLVAVIVILFLIFLYKISVNEPMCIGQGCSTTTLLNQFNIPWLSELRYNYM